MNRRDLGLTAAAGVAAAAGLGGHLWREHHVQQANAAGQQLWTMRLPQPGSFK